MEMVMESVLNIMKAIYAQFKQVKCCKHQSQRLVRRVEILQGSIESLRVQPPKQLSRSLEETLLRLLETLKQAQDLLVKYSHQKPLEKFLKAGDVAEEFANVNERLRDAAEGLSLLLQVEHRQTFLEMFRHDKDSQDLEDDRVTWEEMLRNSKKVKDGVDNIQGGVKHIQSKLEELLRKVEETQCADRNKTEVEITEIEKTLLTRSPWTFLMDFESHSLYKGEYHKFPVAIKVFKTSRVTCTQKVRDLFRKEIKTMKKFESPYILRLYGICIDERGLSPEFSIVMEYCEKGTLRDVLRNEPDVSWTIRKQMALHAAIGLFRLHQTGDKSQLHGCITSAKFLVASGYCVKLSGFELCQTESSIRRKPTKKTHEEVPASAYISPQGLASVNHQYDLPSEIYSFGIVLWEIATGKTPFADCTSKEICQKVYKQGCQEPLGDDCPPGLQAIINQCRDFQPSKRPTAEEIVDSFYTISSETTMN